MIKGNKVILKLVSEADLGVYHLNLTNLSNRGEYYPIFLQSEAMFRKQYFETGFWGEDAGRFLILDLDEKIVGAITFFKAVAAIYSNALELGYILFDTESRGKGYATEALKLMVDYLFSLKMMNRIQLRITAENTASIKVALKCKFQFDGVRKEFAYQNGKHIDLNEYFILRKDWEKEQCAP